MLDSWAFVPISGERVSVFNCIFLVSSFFDLLFSPRKWILETEVALAIIFRVHIYFENENIVWSLFKRNKIIILSMLILFETSILSRLFHSKAAQKKKRWWHKQSFVKPHDMMNLKTYIDLVPKHFFFYFMQKKRNVDVLDQMFTRSGHDSKLILFFKLITKVQWSTFHSFFMCFFSFSVYFGSFACFDCLLGLFYTMYGTICLVHR